MWWYDAAGNWNITASIVDNNSNGAKNDSVLFALGATTGFEINPSALTWSSIGAGSTNQTSNNDPVQLNNTGNQPVGLGAGTGNISINATNLHGESNSAYTIWANNFSVSISTGGTCSGAACLECGGGLTGNLSAFTFANVTTANLTKGNYTINDGFTGEEELYFCLRIAGSELTSQSYSTIGNGSWIMRIY